MLKRRLHLRLLCATAQLSALALPILLLATSAAGQPTSTEIAAEKKALEKYCPSGAPGPGAIALHSVRISSDGGLKCLDQILQAFTLGAAVPDADNVQSSWMLWNVAGLLKEQPSWQAPKTLLEKISAKSDHPLSAEAYLALTSVDNPSLSELWNPSSELRNRYTLLQPTMNALRFGLRDWHDLHPLFRERLTWLKAGAVNGTLNAPAPADVTKPDMWRLAAYLNELARLPGLPGDFGQRLVVDAMRTRLVLPADAPASISLKASDPPPTMDFALSTSICMPGSNCTPYNVPSTTGLQNFAGWTKGWETPPKGEIGLFLAGPQKMGPWRYHARFVSYALGGHQRLNQLTDGKKGEDGTTSLSYNVTGKTKIARCVDPASCSPQVSVSFSGSEAGRNEMSLLVSGNGWQKSVGVGESLVLDRTTGDHELTLSLKHSFSHTGACCEPGHFDHWADVLIMEPAKYGDLPPGFPPPPPGLALGMPFYHLAVVHSIKAQGLWVPTNVAPYGEAIRNLSGAPSFGNRYQGNLLRLVAARELRDRLAGKMTTAEGAALDSAVRAVSSEAKAIYAVEAEAELKKARVRLPLLDSTGLDLAMARIISGSDLVTDVHPLIIALRSSATGAGTTSEPLDALLRALDDARAASVDADVLLHLAEAKARLTALRNEEIANIERLELEINQYSGVAPK